ncbi:MAG: preprotein translocase subunit SecD [Planctomycetota bacterium]|jgi:preprotein translocase subunit SecD
MKTAMLTATWAVLACIASANSQAPAQQPNSPQRITRLIYELPIDAMQRTLLRGTNNTMESLLKQAVGAVAQRLSTAEVTRVSAVSFSVDLATQNTKDIASARDRIESIGSLEMRMLAREDYAEADLGLKQERKRLEAWLDKGGRTKLQADLAAISQFRAAAPDKIRWVPRRVPSDNGRWRHSLSQLPATRDATVRTYTDEQWNNQRVPAALLNNENAFLVELVAINMHEKGFSHRDLKRDAVGLAIGQNGEPCVSYEFVKPRRKDYAAWTEKHIRHATAIIVNGELISAPVFVGRIVGRGVIQGNFSPAEAEALISALQSGALPAKPVLISQNLLPAEEPTGKRSSATGGK